MPKVSERMGIGILQRKILELLVDCPPARLYEIAAMLAQAKWRKRKDRTSLWYPCMILVEDDYLAQEIVDEQCRDGSIRNKIVKYYLTEKGRQYVESKKKTQ